LAAYLSGIKIDTILKNISKVKPVNGRLEQIGKLKNKSRVILDYAHTPDALKTVISNIKEDYPLSKISLVFGCGGDRDKSKRPLMGDIANKYCDKIYLTDDNPRFENPKVIRDQIKRKIKKKSNLYFALLLVQASAQALVFLSQDFLLFFLAWELELVPVYLLIAIWGGKKKLYAATKFILYTALASLIILISGLALALSGDTFTLNITDLTNKQVTGSLGLISYLGFLIGFGVKLPIFPLHTWLPDAHGEANAPVSMLLAGILLKMGGYALLRFNVQILPEVHLKIAPALIILGIINIIYGALNAFAQDNVKRRIACSSVSHMGFVLLGIGAVDALGISGAMLQMISHGLIAAAMFFVTGSFYERTNTLSIPNMGGLAKVLPITFAFFLASSLASLALPGMSGFISEITVFLGITSQEGFSSLFRSITILIAAIGLVLTPIYLLSMCRRVFFGPRIPALATVKEMNGRELTIGFSLLLPTLVIGFWPKIAINLYESSTNALSQQLTLAKLIGLIPTLFN